MARPKGTVDPEREAHWRRILERFRKSGEPFRKFCSRENLSPNTFQAWRKKLRLRDEAEGKISTIKKGENRPSTLNESLAYWKAVLQAMQAYPGSANMFCREHRISSGTLHYWRKRIEELDNTKLAESENCGLSATPIFVSQSKQKRMASWHCM